MEDMHKDKDKEMEIITGYIEVYRKALRLTPTPGYKTQSSDPMFHEIPTLLYSQLVKTINGDGAWKEIEDPEVRKKIHAQIKKDTKPLLKRLETIDPKGKIYVRRGDYVYLREAD